MYNKNDAIIIAQSLSNAVNTTLNKSKSIVNYCKNINKIKIVLTLTLAWVYVSMYMSKLFLVILRALLILPDNLLSLFVYKYPTDTNGNQINIVRAETNNEVLTNKLKIFLQCYWTKGGGESAFDRNGFNIKDFSKLVGATVLYCTYLKEYKNTNPETFWTDINKIMLKTTDDRQYVKITKEDGKLVENDVFLNHVDLD